MIQTSPLSKSTLSGLVGQARELSAQMIKRVCEARKIRDDLGGSRPEVGEARAPSNAPGDVLSDLGSILSDIASSNECLRNILSDTASDLGTDTSVKEALSAVTAGRRA